MKRRKKKVTFMKAQDIFGVAKANKGFIDLSSNVALYTPDGKLLDMESQPRAKTCGICDSPKVASHAVIVVGRHPDDDEEMLAIVLGVCNQCEELGPDVFLPEMARRLQEELTQR